MGLSASQARLLNLEARKTDLEYEGQQINQQRLTLSNKMNEIYVSAMDMEVPTAPSKIDYATEGYTGKVCGTRYEISMGENGSYRCVKHESGLTCSVTKNYKKPTCNQFDLSYNDVNYDKILKVSIEYEDTIGGGRALEPDFNGIPTKYDQDNNKIIDGDEILKRGYKLVDLTNNNDVFDPIVFKDENNNYHIQPDILQAITSGQLGLLETDVNEDGPELVTNIQLLELRDGVAYQDSMQALKNYLSSPEYTQNGGNLTINDFNAVIESDNNGGITITFVPKTYTLNNETETFALRQEYDEDIKTTLQIAADGIALDVKGNITSFTVQDGDKQVKIPVTTNSSAYDEIAYDAAFREYERKKIEYDHEQNELNKQTSLYQRQDKQLELKLTRLDNERNALKTEIDAVKKVIQDASESGFKTFSG